MKSRHRNISNAHVDVMTSANLGRLSQPHVNHMNNFARYMRDALQYYIGRFTTVFITLWPLVLYDMQGDIFICTLGIPDIVRE
jgi:hypothetical protein